MILFSLSEIGLSALGAAALGAVFGFFYQMLCLLKWLLSMLIRVKWKTIIYKNGAKSIYNSLKSKFVLCELKLGNVFDFVVTLLFGVSYLILQFVLCDGVFRLYFLLITLIVFILSKRVFSRFFCGTFFQILLRICAIFLFAAGGVVRLFAIVLKIGKKSRIADTSAP